MMDHKDIRKEIKRIFDIDYNLLFMVILISCFGLIMLYSASSYIAYSQLGQKSSYFLEKQLKWFRFGFFSMIVFASPLIDKSVARWIRGKESPWIDLFKAVPFRLGIMAIAIVACGLTTFLGIEKNGSSRWMSIGGQSFQPSEFAKIIVIIYLSSYFASNRQRVNQLKYALKPLLPVLILLMVIVKTNLSTAIIIAGIYACMMIVVVNKRRTRILILILLAFLGAAGILIESYRMDRISIWLDPVAAGSKGDQTLHSLYAIASGGFFGKGLGSGLLKLGKISEAQNDMIFSVICEELGLFGAVCTMAMFAILIWRMTIIARNARSLYESLLVTGVIAQFAIQVAMNVAVVTNAIPNTGVTLPFISYGGTSVLMLMTEIGMVLYVSRNMRRNQQES